MPFQFRSTSSRDFGKIFEWTDTIFAQSLRNFYDELMIDFTNIRGKHMCQTLYLDRVASSRSGAC